MAHRSGDTRHRACRPRLPRAQTMRASLGESSFGLLAGRSYQHRRHQADAATAFQREAPHARDPTVTSDRRTAMRIPDGDARRSSKERADE